MYCKSLLDIIVSKVLFKFRIEVKCPAACEEMIMTCVTFFSLQPLLTTHWWHATLTTSTIPTTAGVERELRLEVSGDGPGQPFLAPRKRPPTGALWPL